MAVVIKGSGSIEGSTGLEMGANGTTEIRGQVNVAVGSSVAGVSTATNFAPTVIPTSNRNLMINGAMNVAQRGTSDTSTDYYSTVDRWSMTANGQEENLTRSQESLSSSDTGPWEKGFRKAWKIQNGNQTGGADASGYINPQYTIEAQDLASSGWNPADPTSKLTLSFWVKSSVAQTFYSYLYVEDGGGDSYSFSYALSANTWTKVTKIIPGHADLAVNSDNGGGMTIYLPLFLGTDRTTSGHTLNQWQSWSGSDRTPDQTTTWYTTNDATWHITGIQLEVGSVATPFEHLSYGDTLRKCQRYYWRTSANNNEFFPGLGMADTDGNTVILNTPFPIRMRTAPTALEQTGTANNYKIRRSTTATCSSVPTFGHATVDQAATNFISSSHGFGDGSAVRCMGGTSGAYLGWSAEL